MKSSKRLIDRTGEYQHAYLTGRDGDLNVVSVIIIKGPKIYQGELMFPDTEYSERFSLCG